MHVFIDTNVFLSFFHYSNEDLEELHKLVVLVNASKVTLCLPEQVQDEFNRNRDAKIADALRQFTEEKLTANFPQICKEYEEYSELRKLIRAYQEKKSALLEKIKEDFKHERFKADIVIRELFSAGAKIQVTDDVFSKAWRRCELGNPPGKEGSLGDAINWECLLKFVPQMTDLHFITDDSDYFSKTDKETFSNFLEKEWSRTKFSQICLYKRLSVFFKEQFPEIKLATDYERDILTKDLLTSHSFATTRKILSRLSKYSDLTSAQLNDVVIAAITNNQVYWIIQDQDIKQYISQLISGRESQIEVTNLKRLFALLGLNTTSQAEEVSSFEFNSASDDVSSFEFDSASDDVKF